MSEWKSPTSRTQAARVQQSPASPLPYLCSSPKATGTHGPPVCHLATTLAQDRHRNPLASKNSVSRSRPPLEPSGNTGGAGLALRMPREGGRARQIAPALWLSPASPPPRPGYKLGELRRDGSAVPGKGRAPSLLVRPAVRSFPPQTQPCSAGALLPRQAR